MAAATQSDRSRVVLIAVDGSRFSEAAFDWYVTHLHTRATKVIILNVFELPTLQSGAYSSEIADSDFHSWKGKISEVEMEAGKIAKRFLDRCAAYKDLVHYTPLNVGGSPGAVIIEEANRLEADLIVIGSRGLGKISRSLFGSVSDYVVRRANRPVMVVPKAAV